MLQSWDSILVSLWTIASPWSSIPQNIRGLRRDEIIEEFFMSWRRRSLFFNTSKNLGRREWSNEIDGFPAAWSSLSLRVSTFIHTPCVASNNRMQPLDLCSSCPQPGDSGLSVPKRGGVRKIAAEPRTHASAFHLNESSPNHVSEGRVRVCPSLVYG